jgi:hypothetical protein
MGKSKGIGYGRLRWPHRARQGGFFLVLLLAIVTASTIAMSA